MTAIVGILNKRAVAIAADSAVTVGSGENIKIYNTSQKIFQISDKNPVALMIYDRAGFMGAPWDVIINMYRQERGNNTFKKVQDYANDFMKFLTDCEYLNGQEEQDRYVLLEMFQIYTRLSSAVKARIADDFDENESPSEERLSESFNKHFSDVMEELSQICAEVGKHEDLKGMRIEQFMKKTQNNIDCLFNEVVEEEWDEDEKQVWIQAFYDVLTSRFAYLESGLVFVGYGTKSIYPSLYSVKVSGIFNDVLRWTEDDKEDITNDNEASIVPFAQTDVMMTMLKGIAPAFQQELLRCHMTTLNGVVDDLRTRMVEKGVPEDVIEDIVSIDVEGIQKQYEEHCDSFMKDNYTTGVVDAVECFNVEDMANMAESLISITNLQRHISSSEESVGGPVEVAIITRCGGFRWIKHREF